MSKGKWKYKRGMCLRGHDSFRYKSGSCIECQRENAKKRNAERSPKLIEYHKQWYQKNKEKIKERGRIYRHQNRYKIYGNRLAYVYKIKLAVISHYSGGTMSCKRCGIADVDVLCLDHIHDDGKIHRGKGSARNIYIYAHKNKFPYGLQVLCYNCNMKKEINRKRSSSLGYRYAKVFNGGEDAGRTCN